MAVQFKPVGKGKINKIEVMQGVSKLATIDRQDLAPKLAFHKDAVNTVVDIADIIGILRQMGVNLDVKLEAKMETAKAEQLKVLSEARAVRFGKKSSVAAPTDKPKRRTRKKA